MTFQAVILAAGKSTRFQTHTTKLAYTICGQQMILYPLQLLADQAIPTICILGHQQETVKDLIHARYPDTDFCVQTEQNGTGDALCCAESSLHANHILVLNGDMPLLKAETIQKLIATHTETHAAVSFVTAHNADPESKYGRIIEENGTLRIKEHYEFSDMSSIEHMINAGIYLFDRTFLHKALSTLQPHTSSGEIRITDLIGHASDQELSIATVPASFDEIRGVNTLKELWAVEHIKRAELISYWMERGVRFSSAPHVSLDNDVTIGLDTCIGPGVVLTQGTHIGAHCTIEAFSVLKNTTVDDHSTILPHCVCTTSHIKSGASVGPFAHLQNTTLDTNAVLGNFVEAQRSTIGSRTKAKHLSYIGDALIGSGVTVGAGTITCNYDGVSKHRTMIHDHSFIGSNSTLIAPLEVGKAALVGAGSTITDNVPQDALAIARQRQTTKTDYASKHRQKKASKPHSSAVEL